MAETFFIALSSVWLLGLTYFQVGCARIEGQFDPNGIVGAFNGTGWLRGSTQSSRRYRKWAAYWAGVGLMVVVLTTRALQNV